MQSTLASLMFFSLREVAASSYSGARALQWPHHGAKTGSCVLAIRRGTTACVSKRTWRHTLSQDKVVGLDKVLEGVLGQRGDVRLGRGNGGKGGDDAGGNALLMHGGRLWRVLSGNKQGRGEVNGEVLHSWWKAVEEDDGDGEERNDGRCEGWDGEVLYYGIKSRDGLPGLAHGRRGQAAGSIEQVSPLPQGPPIPSGGGDRAGSTKNVPKLPPCTPPPACRASSRTTREVQYLFDTRTFCARAGTRTWPPAGPAKALAP